MEHEGDVDPARIQSKSLKGESQEIEGQRNERQSPIHRPKDGVREQGHCDITRDGRESYCDTRPASDEEFAEYRRQHG